MIEAGFSLRSDVEITIIFLNILGGYAFNDYV
jgi:hypothetical protein